jgi:hypothetical protein
MTYNEINASRTCTPHKYSTVIDKKAQYCLKGSRCNDRNVQHFKTPSLPISTRSWKNRDSNPNPRSKNSFYRKVISKPDPSTARICKKVRKKFEPNRHPIFGGFSPKWTGATVRKRNLIEQYSLNTTMIDWLP